MNTNITATLEITDEGSEYGGQYQSAYIVRLFADGKQIGKNGDVIAGAEGWAIGAWLAPGAHQDIDGSGLELWGDSQPGGWRTADGDGANTGTPRVNSDGAWVKSEPYEPINIDSGEGCLDVQIIPDDIPEWKDACDNLKNNEDNDDNYQSLYDTAYDVRQEVCDAIEEAIEQVLDGSHRPSEPNQEDVYNELTEITGRVDGIDIRVGNYLGCGPVLAWEIDNVYYYEPHPTEHDIETALDSVKPNIIKIIKNQLEKCNIDW